MEKKFILNDCGLRIKNDTDITINVHGINTHMHKNSINKIIVNKKELILYTKDDREFILKYSFYDKGIVDGLLKLFELDTTIENHNKKYFLKFGFIGTATIAIIYFAVSFFDVFTAFSGISDGTITKKAFNEVQNGMTYEQVVDIIGSEGELSVNTDLGLGDAYKSDLYIWYGNGITGANANIMFQGNKVVMKSQIGLK